MVCAIRLARTYLGTHQAHAFIHTRLFERTQELNTAVTHGVILEPVLRRVWRDQQDLQIRVRAQPLGERFCHGGGGQKLVFDVDFTFGRRDHVRKECLDLSYLLLSVAGRQRSRDRDLDIAKVGSDIRPCVIVRRFQRNVFAGGALPTRVDKLSQRARRVAVDDHLHVVKRRVRLTRGIASMWIVEVMP